MRLNIRKIVAVIVVLTFIWVLASYSSLIEVPKVEKVQINENYLDIQRKIDRLQLELDEQVVESNMLLEKVQVHLKRQDPAIDGVDDGKLFKKQDMNTLLPVLVMACDRVTVKRCLDSLVKFRPDKDRFPIIVSQDCGHNATYHVIKSYTDADPTITVVRQPDLKEIPLPSAKIKFRGYYKISRHYKFALNHVFKTLGHEAVIIVEDDLDISPDFFEYFQGTYPLLIKDPTIWCISAWNDNGKKDLIDLSRPELLYRTDFFPGLGWMMRRHSWLKMETNWPPAFFDDWLRNPDNTGGRSCIRPEIPRTYSFGKIGVSKGLFFEVHLRHIQLNKEFVEFTNLNLTYLLKPLYDEWLLREVSSAPRMRADEVLRGGAPAPAVVTYSDARSFQKQAKRLGLMDDFRSGIPRTAYLGIVSCYFRGRRVYLAPDFPWTKYDPTWG